MGLRMLEESKRFAELMAELDEKMEPVAGFSILAELRSEPAASRLDDTVVAQPLLFAIQVAITRLLGSAEVNDLTIEDLMLEEIFMHYYE